MDPDEVTVRSAFRASPLIQVLSDDDTERLAQVSRRLTVPRGEMIWGHGSEVDYFGLACTGFVKMVRPCASGVDVTIELMGPGQIFGLMGTLTGAGCPLSALAVTDLTYIRIPKPLFLEVYERSMPLKDLLIRRSAVRLHGFVDFMARLSTGKVDERIAAILFILAESYGRREADGITLAVPLTRQEISEMAGTTVESTIRTMSRWQKDGLIQTDNQIVRILDESKLSAVLAAG